ncbi:MAG: shikimate kinase, partial [Actinobacteria bacterium]|nr:shikimate kinase [Actinomycetota bacterium]
RTIREVFQTDGEAAFRKLELQALRDVATSGRYKVVSTGGGVVTTSEARQLLQEMDAFVVWLTAPNDELTRRATKSGNRPLLDHDPGAKIEALMNERAPMYAEVADLTLNTQGLSVKQVAQLVEEALKHRVADGKAAP